MIVQHPLKQSRLQGNRCRQPLYTTWALFAEYIADTSVFEVRESSSIST